MKLKEPANEAYSATIVRLENTYPLENSDNLVGSRFMGYSAVISKDTPLGLHVMFSPETQIDYEYAHENNLHRHSNLNKDQSAKGYLEDNRRVRAIRLRGNVSNCILMPLESLSYTGADISQFKEGDTFDELNGISICKKYVVPGSDKVAQSRANTPKFSRVDKRLMPEHIKTVQYFRHPNEFRDKMLVVTQKLHGCFSSGTKVSMWDGSQKKIKDIVAGDELLGYESGALVKAVAKRDAFTTGKTKEWQKIKVKSRFKGDKPTLYSTPEHKIFTKNRGWVEAQNLVDSDELIVAKPNYPLVDDVANSALIGLALGDGSFSRNGGIKSMHWSHKSDHEEYMNYLREILGSIMTESNGYSEVESGFGTTMLRDSTISHPHIDQLSIIFDANGGKEVSADFEYDAVSLAIHYMDDGSRTHSETQKDRISFAVCRYTEESVDRIVSALVRYGCVSPVKYQTGDHWRIRLNKDDAEFVFKSIRHVIPKSMEYKLPDYHRGYFDDSVLSRENVNFHASMPGELFLSEVVDTRQHQFSTKWDIETSTSNFFANRVLVHNSSVRISNIPVAKELSWKDKIAKKLGINISEQEYDYVYGSRRVIKDSRGEQQHFYDEDLWTSTGERVKDSVPKNYILYGEIIGWVNEHKPIQPNYTYNLKPGTSELYIYRVATVNPDGFVTDLSWDGVKEFCKERGLNYVPELTRSIGWNETVTDHYMNKRYYDEGFKQAIPLSDPKTKDEGICIRYEAQLPVIAKAKCSEFLGHETKILDQQQEDLEQS